MNRYAYSHRSQLVVLSLLGVLALTVLLMVQMPRLNAPEIQRPANTAGQALNAAGADELAAVDPADRKFFSAHYGDVSSGGGQFDYLANVLPNDPVLFSTDFGDRGSGAADSLADINPADRKFFSAAYGAAPSAAAETDFLANVLPNDPALYAVGARSERRAGSDAGSRSAIDPADRKLLDAGYLDSLLEQMR